MELDLFWLFARVAVWFAVRGIYRRLRYAHLLRIRRRAASDRPVQILYYISQPLRR